jgi:hypothetical protein
MLLSAVMRRRLLCAAFLSGVIVCGIVTRVAPIGWPVYDKSLGDVLYAVAAYLAVALLFPRMPATPVACIAAVACLAVEGLKLTDLNARLLTVPVVRWFLGTTFSWHNIACYLLGIAIAGWLDARLSGCLFRQGK